MKYWFEALVGLALLDRGDRAEAMRTIGPAVQARPEQFQFAYVVAAQWAELGEAAAAAGLSQATQRYYDALRPHAGTAVVIAAAVGFGGAVDHHLGRANRPGTQPAAPMPSDSAPWPWPR